MWGLLCGHHYHLLHSRRTSHQHNFVNFGFTHSGIRQALVHNFNAFFNISMFICSLDFQMKVLSFMDIRVLQRWPPHRNTTLYWPAHMHCKVSKALLHLRMCWFCIFFKFLPKLAHQSIVKILTSQMGVSSNCLDLDFVLLNAKHDNIEIPSTQIEDKDILTIVWWISCLVKSICTCNRSWLIQYL